MVQGAARSIAQEAARFPLVLPPILFDVKFTEHNAYLNVLIPQEIRMHWKKRQKQIQYLQAKHGNDRSLVREPPGMKQFPVGHCHKQGYELIIPGTDLQWMGGKKP